MSASYRRSNVVEGEDLRSGRLYLFSLAELNEEIDENILLLVGLDAVGLLDGPKVSRLGLRVKCSKLLTIAIF